MVFQNDILAGSSGASGASSVYQIDQSIRFNSTDTAYMHRTPISSGNRDTWTWSCWVKRGNLTSDNATLFQAGADSQSNDVTTILFNGNSGGVASLKFNNIIGGSTKLSLETSQYFRDVSAWYHIVCVYDSNNGTESDRARIYVNGNRVTSFNGSPTFPDGDDSMTNHTVKQSIGRRNQDTSRYMDGYMAEIVLLDGTATDSSSFGEFTTDGIWIPKDVSSLSFGTNGFHLKGETANDLGNDSNGSNNFTASNLTQVLDTPTNNFCTINSVYADNAPAGNAGTLSNGNLQYVGGGSTFSVKGLTFNLPKSGKWYFEYMIGGNLDGFGFVKQGEQGTINASNGAGQLSVAQGGGIQNTAWRNGGNNTTTFADSNTGSPFTAGFIHQVAIDVDNGKFYYGVKNTYYATDGGNDGNPSGGTNHMSTFDFSTTDVVLLAGNYSGTQYWNFGQDGTFSGQQTAQGNSDANGVGNFYYAPPTNYLALCTKNLGS